jgi:hypothetical protein
MINMIRGFSFTFILILGISIIVKASPPDTINWILLQDLEFKSSQHPEYGEVFLPKFSKKITKYANKEVVIRGYLVPVDKTIWALSKSTYASCFFCGKAGPETVMGLLFKDTPEKLKMDANVYIKGKLKVNGDNVDDWMYSLQNAVIVK